MILLRDTTLFAAALVLIGLGLAAGYEESWPGLIAGLGTASAIAFLLIANSTSGIGKKRGEQ